MDLGTPPRTGCPMPIPAVLRTAVRGTVVFPTDPGWAQAAVTWSIPFDQPPHALVVAESMDDVRATLAYAVHHGLRVAPQDTGDARQGNVAAPDAGDRLWALGDLKDTILLWTTVTNQTGAAVPATAAR